MRKFGLIGKKLGHSFSKQYFTEKFKREGIADTTYELYELQEVEELKSLLQREPDLAGLNVTIPYKQQVIPLLDEMDEAATRIGAVNTIRIRNGKTRGFNTDYVGFKSTLDTFYPINARGKALVLGTGGAAQAVITALADLHIPYKLVSRDPGESSLYYGQLTKEVLQQHNLLVNTTPLGMAPHTATFPELNYGALTSDHYVYDLVYNPEQTVFLQKAAAAGAHTMNGLQMLYAQAEAAWRVWNL
ncbi:shikimate dehydrogenase family protein [Pontibacter sp. MBLB2868]|uniref:shikimate dehydrogenase family protein n=1 Tax=Pontibacter sp. MBLB2868 TaxID=3451555 RepID=UPI003F74C1FB